MTEKKHLPTLEPSSSIDIVAIAGRCQHNEYQQAIAHLNALQLNLYIAGNLQGDDLLCANSLDKRFAQLKRALVDSNSDAIWALRGGYGSAQLIPLLEKLEPPKQKKLFIGFSDICAVHLFLQQQWNWPVLHGPVAKQIGRQTIDDRSQQHLFNVIFGKSNTLNFDNLTALNDINAEIEAPITGGNLSLLQTSIGTSWEVQAVNKILLIEEVGERGYQVDRMLLHLQQAGIFKNVSAIIFGDFTESDEPDGTVIVDQVLRNFASRCHFPVLQLSGIGHGETNLAIPFGINSTLSCADKSLTINLR